MFQRFYPIQGLASRLAIIFLALGSQAAQAQFTIRPVPVKNVVAMTTDNYCKGLPSVFATTKQDIKEQTDVLCLNGAPTSTFNTLISTAFRGTGAPVITTIRELEIPAALSSEIFVTYALRIPKNAVATLLGEEKHVLSPYQQGNLTINARFLPTPINLGEADTAFSLEQKTIVRDNVSFDDTSLHSLRMYTLYPNNFDFFLAARTLNAPSEQFKKSVVVRAVIGDATDPKFSYSITVLHFVMNSREQHERVVTAFMNFIRSDAMALYTANSGT